MRALIFADRLGRELQPLVERSCVALLPVVGKAVLEHALERLAAAGLRQALIAISPQAEELRAAFGDGSRWGMRLHYVLTRGEAEPDDILALAQPHLTGELLALRGDVLHGANLSAFLQAASGVTGPVVYGKTAAGMIGYCLHRAGGRGGLERLRWSARPDSAAPVWPAVEIEGSVRPLESLRAYHQANLDAAAGRLPELLAPGRQVALGLTVGLRSSVSPRSLRQGVAWIGGGCRIDSSAELHGEVVIGEHVIVDRLATLRDSVVLPDTYIGELVEVRNAIVQGNRLIRVDIGAVLSVAETFLLADLGETTLAGALAEPLNRLLGVLLLGLSLPLWPLALLAGLADNPRQPLQAVWLRGNRLDFDDFGMRQRRRFPAWEWATPVPILRYLPRLLAVASGDLRLIGTEPLTPEQAAERSEEWERLGDRAPAGLIGPTQLLLPAAAPREERLMSDAFYARQRSAGRDLYYAARALGALFTPRAWWPA
ncbi:MAG: sugar transferase [Candidatus Competibacteraceae bacterium]|nr:sugar transferase [Candidatus Competibacteraceae bacterium]